MFPGGIQVLPYSYIYSVRVCVRMFVYVGNCMGQCFFFFSGCLFVYFCVCYFCFLHLLVYSYTVSTSQRTVLMFFSFFFICYYWLLFFLNLNSCLMFSLYFLSLHFFGCFLFFFVFFPFACLCVFVVQRFSCSYGTSFCNGVYSGNKWNINA